MKEERIKSLLYRYYKGISTEEEEVELRQFFLNETIAGFEAERNYSLDTMKYLLFLNLRRTLKIGSFGLLNKV